MSHLFVRLPNHLGDACMSAPALDLLAANGFVLTLVGRAWAPDLFAAYPWHTLLLKGNWHERARTLARCPGCDDGRYAGTAAHQLVRQRPRFFFSPAAPPPVMRPTCAAGCSNPHSKYRCAGAAGMHMVEYYYTLAAKLIGIRAQPPARLDLKVSDASRQRAHALLDAAGVRSAYVMLCPVAVGLHRGRIKAWDGFGRLCDELQAQGRTVVACPGPGEQASVAAVLKAAVLLPATDVGTFAALLSMSELVVANDSGPGHVAAAVGARLVSVFGVTEPTRTRPWGSQVTLVGSERGWPGYDEVASTVAGALGAA